MTIDSNIIDTTGGAAAFPVLSIALESMVMVLDCPCLAMEAQLIQNLLNMPLTKFGSPALPTCEFCFKAERA